MRRLHILKTKGKHIEGDRCVCQVCDEKEFDEAYSRAHIRTHVQNVKQSDNRISRPFGKHLLAHKLSVSSRLIFSSGEIIFRTTLERASWFFLV